MAGILRPAATRSISRRLSAAQSRRQAASAAAELEYWTDWEDEDKCAGPWPGAAAAVDAWGNGGERGLHWVFMGSHATQRHVHGVRLAELLDVPYISMGSLVRQELSPHSSLYKKIANAVNEGKRVPENIIFGLLSKRLSEGKEKGENGFILDGIPRTRMQAEILDQIVKIDLAVNFKCSNSCLTKRKVCNICLHCGKSFNANNAKSADTTASVLTINKADVKMHVSQLVNLEDPRVQNIHLYSDQNKSMEEYYRNEGKLLDVATSTGVTETWRVLLAALHLQHVDGGISPHKLSAG